MLAFAAARLANTTLATNLEFFQAARVQTARIARRLVFRMPAQLPVHPVVGAIAPVCNPRNIRQSVSRLESLGANVEEIRIANAVEMPAHRASLGGCLG